MKTRLFVFSLLLSSAMILHAADTSPSKPNIILIVADDLGINDLSCYGRRDQATPNLDRLASEGLRFTSALTAQSICSPSRAALLTGKTPARLNLTNFLPGRADAASQRLLQPRIEGQLPLEEVTIAELLKNAGYATGIFGKWHLGGRRFGPQEQGFDTFVAPDATTKPTLETGGKGEFAITAAAVEFITQNRDKAFFCYVPHNNPHIPLSAAPELIEKFHDSFNPAYAAMIATLDDAVGRLMKKVAELGLADRTIFIFTSDNGGLHVLEFPGTPATHNTPFCAGKGYLYEGGLRVPLLIRWPKVIEAGRVCDEPVVLTDLVPTLLEAAGIDVAQAVGPLDGVSLASLMRGKKSPDRALYWHFPHYTNQGGRPASAIRENEWKLIHHLEEDSIELYNLKNDPGETNNLVPSESARAQELRRKLDIWRASVGARMPTENKDFDSKLHAQLYVDQDSSQLVAGPTAKATAPAWQKWRESMNAVTKGRAPRVTPATGDVRLHAKDAIVHGNTLRYEPNANKNVLGYWTNPADWAEWSFDTPAPGNYEIEVQVGCGAGNPGSEVEIVVANKSFTFVVPETGHFQQMILLPVGTINLPGGKNNLAVKPRTKRGAAVMDLRRVVLRPIVE